MNLDKVSAERDSLLQALKRAEEEIARARTGQQQAEVRLAEMRTRSGATMAPARSDANQAAIAQAQAAQKRAESTARSLEEHLRGHRAEQEKIRVMMDGLTAENQALREQNEELRTQLIKREEQDPDSSTSSGRAEQRSLRDELDAARVEIQRLRTLVVKVASETRTGIAPREIPAFPPTDSQTLPVFHPTPSTPPTKSKMEPPRSTTVPAAKSSKVEVDCGPKSGARHVA